MTIRVAINGYGRIGRSILRAYYESGKSYNIKIVAINDLSDIKINAYLTNYDTAHGKFSYDVKTEGNCLVIGNDSILMLSEKSPENLPWRELNIDVVLECTGSFADKKKAFGHLKSGAKKIIISAPGGSDVDATVVYGINHHTLKESDTVISNASCTTNCLVPLIKPLYDSLGVAAGLMTTVHSYTNDQVLTDACHKDLRRARAAASNMIPTKTGAASSVGLVIPDLIGKLDGYAIRVPTLNVSFVDLSLLTLKETTVEEVNGILKSASEGNLKGILSHTTEALVSTDFNHNSNSSIVDASLTKVIGKLIKVCAWYDNEWGFSNRMLDTTAALMSANK